MDASADYNPSTAARRRFQWLPRPAYCASASRRTVRSPRPATQVAGLFFSLGAQACAEGGGRKKQLCGLPHKNRVLNLRDDLQPGEQTTGQGKVNLMASSMRKDVQPGQVPEEDATAAEEDTTLNIGHAGLASECWLGARGTGHGIGREQPLTFQGAEIDR